MKSTKLKFAIITAAIFAMAFPVFSQGNKGKKDPTKLLLNYTFNEVTEGYTDSEPGGAQFLRLVKDKVLDPTFTDRPADLYYGAPGSDSPYGIGNNKMGFALPITETQDMVDPSDKGVFLPGAVNNDGQSGFAGIVVYKPGNLQKERTYVTIPFVDKDNKEKKMIKGKTYCVEMAISLAEASAYATNNIGMLFSKSIYDLNRMDALGVINKEDSLMVLNYRNKIYNNYSSWDKVCSVYRAKGGENGVVIGNFYTNPNTKFELQKKIVKMEGDAKAVPMLKMAYYYIDNVRIKEVENKTECHCYKADTAETNYEYSTALFSKVSTVKKDAPLVDQIAAQTIYFGFGKTILTDAGKTSLDAIIAVLKENPSKTITITGHSDEEEDRMSAEIEELMEMDKKRVELIEKLIIKAGISADRLTIKNNSSKEQNSKESDSDDDIDLKWAKNRRIEFSLNK